MINQLKKTDRFLLIPILISILTIVIISASFLVVKNYLPQKLPLFYSLPWGETQLATKELFLLLPGLLILVNFLNIFLASQLHQSQFVLKRVLMLSLILINLIILTTAVKILFIFI